MLLRKKDVLRCIIETTSNYEKDRKTEKYTVKLHLLYSEKKEQRRQEISQRIRGRRKETKKKKCILYIDEFSRNRIKEQNRMSFCANVALLQKLSWIRYAGPLTSIPQQQHRRLFSSFICGKNKRMERGKRKNSKAETMEIRSMPKAVITS